MFKILVSVRLGQIRLGSARFFFPTAKSPTAKSPTAKNPRAIIYTYLHVFSGSAFTQLNYLKR